ncbi:MAG: DUF3427 domain-containing protein [Anaerolineae bacterium]|nr:DUF3427 domain-containing protein [Anaerolineae bacterium]
MSPFPKKHLTVGGSDPFLPSLLAAINHATEISITSAFIRMTGLRLIQGALVDAIAREATVRILTGDYLGITEPNALRYLLLLQEQGAQVKVFESNGRHSFHMKAYLFTHSVHGSVEDGCAFIGSSNISQSALENGLEWNLKIERTENRFRFQQIMDEYDALYSDPRCKQLTHQWIDCYIQRIPTQQQTSPVIDAGADEIEPLPEPNDIQVVALDALSATREQGYRRGLVVMATGLGKTWLAAFDSHQVNAKRLLFVAHREEILNQAEETFVQIRPDVKVGRYDGRARDLNVDMLFASIQSLGREHHLDNFAKDHFDYIVVDEFHHAAARTYQRLLAYFTPRFLLGLTATPDRTDQSDILSLCDDNLVFSNDLFAGIESKLLCPFHYQGIADIVNYQEISWRSGKFDPNELVNQLATNARARHNLKHWQEHHQTRTLAFCVSKKHADFMADYFNRHGVVSVSVHSDSKVLRNEALTQLRDGKIRVIFSVDLFNEGVDLPAIDTVLMLRPTDSKIMFLQQLGRGLRTSPGTDKEKLVVLDFIGNHISFFRKPEALFRVGVTNKARKEFIEKIKERALGLPEGCFVNYDLKSIAFMEKLIGTRVDRQLEIYRALRDSYGRRPVLSEFYRAGGVVDTVQKEHGQWLNFVKEEQGLVGNEELCLTQFGDFFAEIEITNLTKSFKLVLLEALIELEGFKEPPSTLDLATKSFEVLQRRRVLLVDLPKQYSQLQELPSASLDKWHKYWRDNPINAWIGGNIANTRVYFAVADGSFGFQSVVPAELYDAFVLLVQEIVSYRFLQYEARLANRGSSTVDNIYQFDEQDHQEIPYFADLRIACGHFETSQHEGENIEYLSLPLSYGKLDPARHFIARASGNSMDGGLSPIKNGDFLLLEMITPVSAGSNDGKIVAIERQDVTGDDQYLLRTVKKLGDNRYQLLAKNLDFEPLMATEDMNTFARFKQVVPPADLYLHKSLMREDIPGLFGLGFNPGLWQSGHVCPIDHTDQILLVTLNKQGKLKDHQYHDYFIDQSNFHWQSQNSTSPSGSKGKAITNHVSDGSRIHLFVRKNKLEAKKAAPFIYCGELKYQSHNGEKPMNVEWLLEAPLSESLFEYFS